MQENMQACLFGSQKMLLFRCHLPCKISLSRLEGPLITFMKTIYCLIRLVMFHPAAMVVQGPELLAEHVHAYMFQCAA